MCLQGFVLLKGYLALLIKDIICYFIREGLLIMYLKKKSILMTNDELLAKIKELELENQQYIYENTQLKRMASYDLLTQLPNRYTFNEQIKLALSFCLRNKQKLAILFIDINGFKLINDNYGHMIGDLLLVEVARSLCCSIRASDVISRFGGDEFLIGLTSIGSKKDVTVVTNKIINSLSKIKQINGITCNINVSIGVCLFPDDADNINDLIKISDLAMYRAKQDKGTNVIFYTN